MTDKQRDKARERAVKHLVRAVGWLYSSEDQDFGNKLSVFISAVERRRVQSGGATPD